MFYGILLFFKFYVDCWFPSSVVVQVFEEKDYFGVDQFVPGSPTPVEVQGFVVLLAFQGHAEGVWPFWCRRLVALSRT